MSDDEIIELMNLLQAHNARATFFFIWTEMHKLYLLRPSTLGLFIEKIKKDGHEIGVHFDGRWGCTKPAQEFVDEADKMQKFLYRHFQIKPKYVRPPGGFATYRTIAALKHLNLTTVIGTAYPFDVDLCPCLGARRLGECAASMSRGGGRIAILHDRVDVYPKVKAFLEKAVDQDEMHVVTLDTLLEGIRDYRSLPPMNL